MFKELSPPGKKGQNRTVPNWLVYYCAAYRAEFAGNGSAAGRTLLGAGYGNIIRGAVNLLVLRPGDCVGELDFLGGLGCNIDIPGNNAVFFVDYAAAKLCCINSNGFIRRNGNSVF